MIFRSSTSNLVWKPTSALVSFAGMTIAANLKRLRETARLSQPKLAALSGVSQQLISQIENGKNTTTKMLPALARALNVHVSEIDSSYIPEPDVRESAVLVMGFVGAGAEINPDFEQVPEDGFEEVTLPFPLPAEMIAFRVLGSSMLPILKPDTIIVVFREQRQPIESFYGDEAAVRTSDGKRYIKTIRRGSRKGVVTLESPNAELIEDVKLEWIGEIFATLPRKQISKLVRLGGIQGRLALKAAE